MVRTSNFYQQLQGRNMKKMISVIALSAISTSASAFDYKINLEGRADFVNANIKTTSQADVKTTEKFNNFSNGLIRLNLMGSINESLSYRFRYRFIKSAANPQSLVPAPRENITDNGVDYLYVDHKNSIFTTRLGKHNWGGLAYGREGAVSGTDVFLVSEAGTKYKTAFGSDYRFGATAMFKFMETNSLDLAISNPNANFSDNGVPSATAPEKKNTGLAFGALYNGSFADKLIQPTFAYQIAQQNGDTDAAVATKTKDVNYTMWNVGLRTESAGLIIDTDYKQLKKANRNDGTNVTAANKEQKTKSIYANVAYPVGDFTPMVTYINDKYTTEETATATDANFKKNSFAVGTYWKPMSDVNFRYHLMVTNAVTKFEGTVATNKKITDTKVYFGFKADI